MLSAEGDLFGLGEVLRKEKTGVRSTRFDSDESCSFAHLVDVSVQLHGSDVLNGDELLGPDLGSVEHVEGELVLVLLRDDLDSELPSRVGSSIDGVVEISSVEVRILSVELEGGRRKREGSVERRRLVESVEKQLTLRASSQTSE